MSHGFYGTGSDIMSERKEGTLSPEKSKIKSQLSNLLNDCTHFLTSTSTQLQFLHFLNEDNNSSS